MIYTHDDVYLVIDEPLMRRLQTHYSTMYHTATHRNTLQHTDVTHIR